MYFRGKVCKYSGDSVDDREGGFSETGPQGKRFRRSEGNENPGKLSFYDRNDMENKNKRPGNLCRLPGCF